MAGHKKLESALANKKDDGVMQGVAGACYVLVIIGDKPMPDARRYRDTWPQKTKINHSCLYVANDRLVGLSCFSYLLGANFLDTTTSLNTQRSGKIDCERRRIRETEKTFHHPSSWFLFFLKRRLSYLFRIFLRVPRPVSSGKKLAQIFANSYLEGLHETLTPRQDGCGCWLLAGVSLTVSEATAQLGATFQLGPGGHQGRHIRSDLLVFTRNLRAVLHGANM